MNKRKIIGEHIRSIRKEQHLTQEVLAELVSIKLQSPNGGNPQTISRIENASTNYGIDTLIAVAEAFDMLLKDLIPDSI